MTVGLRSLRNNAFFHGQDHPFFYKVYALKPEGKAMKPAAGALVWTRSQTAEAGDIDLQISATHLIANAGPTQPNHNLQIRMVAGFVEVAERKEILVAGVGFEPTTFGL